MRLDQQKRLADLEEALVDVFLEEADPQLWPGAGTPLADMEQEVRGNRYWTKKNAAATMVLINGVTKLKDNTREGLGRDPYNTRELDEQIARAEKQASKLVERVVEATRNAGR